MHSETNFKDLNIFKSKSKEYVCGRIDFYFFIFYILAHLALRALFFDFSQGGALEIDLKAFENEAKS